MIETAIIAYITAFLCYWIQWTFGQPMLDQPLGVGLVAGIAFGDITTGIIIGAALQAIFIGSVNVGGATSADTVAGTVLAVCFVTVSDMDKSVAIPLATAAAIFANIIYSLVFNVIMSFWAPIIDWAASKGDKKSIMLCHLGGGVVMNALLAIPVFLAVLVGAEPASQLMDMVPQTVLNGFNTVSGLLPAVGMALLLRMLWDNKLAVYFLLGFVLFQYLGLPMIAIAALGVVLVAVNGMREMETLDLRNQIKALRAGGVSAGATSEAELEEEDFFA